MLGIVDTNSELAEWLSIVRFCDLQNAVMGAPDRKRERGKKGEEFVTTFTKQSSQTWDLQPINAITKKNFLTRLLRSFHQSSQNWLPPNRLPLRPSLRLLLGIMNSSRCLPENIPVTIAPTMGHSMYSSNDWESCVEKCETLQQQMPRDVGPQKAISQPGSKRDNMIMLMRVFGPEGLEPWNVRNIDHIPDSKLLVIFHRWNPNFFQWFHLRRGMWVPRLGFRQEYDRRSAVREAMRDAIQRFSCEQECKSESAT